MSNTVTRILIGAALRLIREATQFIHTAAQQHGDGKQIEEMQQCAARINATVEVLERMDRRMACTHEWRTTGGFGSDLADQCRKCGEVRL